MCFDTDMLTWEHCRNWLESSSGFKPELAPNEEGGLCNKNLLLLHLLPLLLLLLLLLLILLLKASFMMACFKMSLLYARFI